MRTGYNVYGRYSFFHVIYWDDTQGVVINEGMLKPRKQQLLPMSKDMVLIVKTGTLDSEGRHIYGAETRKLYAKSKNSLATKLGDFVKRNFPYDRICVNRSKGVSTSYFDAGEGQIFFMDLSMG